MVHNQDLNIGNSRLSRLDHPLGIKIFLVPAQIKLALLDKAYFQAIIFLAQGIEEEDLQVCTHLDLEMQCLDKQEMMHLQVSSQTWIIVKADPFLERVEAAVTKRQE